MTGPAALSEAAQAWAMTKDTSSVAVLEAFSRQFSNTVYAALARARVDELRRSQTAAIAPSAPVAPPPAAAPPKAELLPAPQGKPSAFEAAQSWAGVKDSTNPAVVQRFLRDFGESIHAADARSRLNELKKKPQLAAAPPAAATPAEPVAPAPPANRPVVSTYDAAQAWVKIRSSTNPADVEAYLRDFDNTLYADMAKKRLEDLKKLALASPVTQAQRPSATTPAVGVFSAARPKSPLTASEEAGIKPKDVFQECANCPEMTVAPSGQFKIGSPDNEAGRAANEGPQRDIVFQKNFAVGKFAVTFDEWDACVSGGGCNAYRPADEGQQRGRYPVLNVSWQDAQSYVAWLSKTTGKAYRLLSESEREYVTRAGTTTPFWFGPTVSTAQANYDGRNTYGAGVKGEFRQRTLPVDTLAANPWGLHHVHGNVDEWVADCWFGNFDTAPADGSARTGECGRRVLRGGSWYEAPAMLRAASRTGFYPGFRSNKIGFRVARAL